MIGASSRRRLLSAVAALGILLRGAASIAQEAEERVVPNWVPSIGAGFGLQSREINGTTDAILFEGTTGPPPPISMRCQTLIPSFPDLPPLGGFCDASGDDNTASDGGAFNLSAQLLGPAWKSAPLGLRPRPFVHAGWALEFDSRTIVETGEIPNSFSNNGLEPDLHTRLRANPNSIWYVGGGVALQMPIHFTPVFVKIGGHYLEERMDAVGTIDRGFAIPGGTEVHSTQNARGLTIKGAGPSFGIEAEIWRFGPVALEFVADFLTTFPISGTETSFDLDEPRQGGDPAPCATNPSPTCNPPAHFKFDADNTSFFGIASLRFGWVGY